MRYLRRFGDKVDLENCHLEVAPWQLYNSPGTAIRKYDIWYCNMKAGLLLTTLTTSARLLGKVSPALRIAIRLVGIVRLLGFGAF